jgi:hypothetical protein
MKILNMYRTCTACPSQWEGKLDNGNYIYIRYRWGNLFIGEGKTLDEAIGAIIIRETIGESLDGFLSNEELLKELKKRNIDYTKEVSAHLIKTNINNIFEIYSEQK